MYRVASNTEQISIFNVENDTKKRGKKVIRTQEDSYWLISRPKIQTNMRKIIHIHREENK